MKITLLFLFLLIASSAFSQNFINEGFEGTDSLPPPGWTVVNAATFPIDPATNWVVRDSGEAIPGLSTATLTPHSGDRAMVVSWWSSQDTNGGGGVSNAWLITKSVVVNNPNFIVRFWVSGGNASYSDSLQIWASFTDSIPASFSERLGSVFFPAGSVYGQYIEKTYSLSSVNFGVPVWIGFRYNMDCAVDGFAVHVDDVFVGDPTSINMINSEIPGSFSLKQNYPNPFNPVTKIQFDIARTSDVKLVVYNSVGQVVQTLLDGNRPAGTYEATFDASSLPSGTYFYRLTAGNFVETKKMSIIK